MFVLLVTVKESQSLLSLPSFILLWNVETRLYQQACGEVRNGTSNAENGPV